MLCVSSDPRVFRGSIAQLGSPVCLRSEAGSGRLPAAGPSAELAPQEDRPAPGACPSLDRRPPCRLSGVLHHCHVLASEMVHFIHQMQYYITFEVGPAPAAPPHRGVPGPGRAAPPALGPGCRFPLPKRSWDDSPGPGCRFQVLECSWDELWNQAAEVVSDHIIAAHGVFPGHRYLPLTLDADPG